MKCKLVGAVMPCLILLASPLIGPQAEAGELRASAWSATPEVTVGGEVDARGFSLGRQEVSAEGEEETAVGAKVEFGEKNVFGVEALSLEASIHQNRTFALNAFGFDVSQNADVDADLEATFLRLRYSHHFGNPEEATLGILLTAQLTDVVLDASATGAGSITIDQQGVLPAAGLTAMLKVAPWLRFSGEALVSFWDSEELIATFVDFSAGASIHVDPFFAGIQYRSITFEFEELDNGVDIDLSLTGPQVFAGFSW